MLKLSQKTVKTDCIMQSKLFTMLGPNNELCCLFHSFSENMEITDLRKISYLSENMLKAD